MILDFYSLGEELYIKGNYLEAYNDFQKGYQLGINTNDCLNYMGCCQMELGNLFEALKIFDCLIEKTAWERPLFNKGRVYLKMGEMDKALAYFKKAERENPENPDVYYYLGVYYEKIKDYGTAQKYYQRSLELDPDQPETQLNLGVMCLGLGQLDKA